MLSKDDYDLLARIEQGEQVFRPTARTQRARDAFAGAVTCRWEYGVVAPSDMILTDELDELGRQGWEVVSARRASDGATSPPRFSYEFILKRRISALAILAPSPRVVGTSATLAPPRGSTAQAVDSSRSAENALGLAQQRTADSLTSAADSTRRTADSARRAREQRRTREVARDSAARANWWRRIAPTPWAGSKANHRYYRVAQECWTGQHIAPSDRIYLSSDSEARQAGYRDVAEHGCYRE